MKYPKSTTQPPMTTHAYRTGVICSMPAILALAVLCSTPSIAQCVVGTNAALSFDGANDIVDVPANALLGGTSTLTVEFWIKTAQTTQAGIVSNGHADVNNNLAGSWIIQLLASGQVMVQLQTCTLSACQAQFLTPGSSTFNDGNWHHFAFVFNQPIVNLYRDGVLVESGAFGLGLNQNALVVRLGGLISVTGGTVPPFFLNGSMDDLRVWSIPRTQAEIQSTMNRGLTLVEAANTNLVGYWRLDEGSGQTVFNSATATGSALNGTLGANALPGTDDPTWIATGLPSLPYCPPCPNPPCGQVNSLCATLTVNGVGAAAQGPFNVVVPAGSTLGFNWSGPANQPYVLVATTNLVPGQVVAPPSFVVDVNIGNFAFLFSGFDPYWGQFFFTNAAGASSQSFAIPTTLFGTTLNVQGFIYDLNQTCSGGLGFMTTASFAIQL